MQQDQRKCIRLWRGYADHSSPLCMYNLNKNQTGDLPVYYFTELLAQALGVASNGEVDGQ